MPQGLSEERVRVIIYLPVKRLGERQAYSEIITFLCQQQQGPSQFTFPITGFTYNAILPSPYQGWWLDQKARPQPKWRQDEIASLFIDFNVKMSDVQQVTILEKDLRLLKNLCLDRYYKATNRRQKEIWMGGQRIQRSNKHPCGSSRSYKITQPARSFLQRAFFISTPVRSAAQDGRCF